MARTKTILVLSDPHYASAPERARTNFEREGIDSAFTRLLITFWRRFIWLRDPFAHNYLLDDFIARAKAHAPDLVIANGDYSCDSAFIGLADTAARQSANECLTKLREAFGEKLITTIGDHELGKSTLAGNRGGLRLESWRVTTHDLNITPAWFRRIDNHVLIGVTSTLIALEVMEPDALPDELAQWRELRAQHMETLRGLFDQVRSDDRLILFCHDPTALPFLAKEKFLQDKLPQLERTIIGHLHTPMVIWKARLLAGFPPINFMGRGIRRISRGLNRAKHWQPFKLLLCPSPSGSQLLKDGGYYQIQLTPNSAATFTRHRLPWRNA